MSTVDVIVPCYNYGRYLNGCVCSVLSQPDIAVRVLIIDDASSDNTAVVGNALATSDIRVEFRRHEVNKGHIATYNEGIEWAQADYMLILSADDYLLPGALWRATNLMEVRPDVSFTFGAVIVLAKGATPRLECLPKQDGSFVLTGPQFIALSGGGDVVATPTAVVRTTFQKKVGGYRPELPHTGDMEMWLRLAARGAVGYVAEPQAVYRLHSENMSFAYSDTFLPDLEHRRKALDYFYGDWSHSHTARLRRRAMYQLSCTGIGRASQMLDKGQLDASKKLIEFALRNCSWSVASLSWAKFLFKRALYSIT
jgi:hypothetical protein